MSCEQCGRVDEGHEVQGSARHEANSRYVEFKRKVSDFWRAKNYLIPDRHPIGFSNLSAESLPNHHLALHGNTFPENPSTLSETQPAGHPRQREISQFSNNIHNKINSSLSSA
ncbi:hypothetical protein CDAR_563701 [Caerostris darwini]|uniref:Uncharacterized protein n=1 Tax=Caerostris darwini TaxID=1538125 RepID=A0AAV4VCC6_9ARAC|nr:hypothetical protein CDAR_563701 [Caerostris darwini]